MLCPAQLEGWLGIRRESSPYRIGLFAPSHPIGQCLQFGKTRGQTTTASKLTLPRQCQSTGEAVRQSRCI